MAQIIFRVETGGNLALLKMLRDEGVPADQFLKSAGALEHLFAINVNNAFDVDYMRANKLLGDRRSVFFTYTLTHGGKR